MRVTVAGQREEGVTYGGRHGCNRSKRAPSGLGWFAPTTSSWSARAAGGIQRIQLKRGTHAHYAKGKLRRDADFDPLLPSQVFDKAIYHRPASGEERMAWRFLERNILDACQGRQRARLKFITEMEEWIAAGEQAPFSFAYWCSLLGVEEPFMRDRFSAFLVEQRANALADIRGSFKILRQIEAVRIEQPHTLSWEGEDAYKCLSCLNAGNMEHFLGYTCVRTQPTAAEGLKQLSEVIHEDSNSQPLDACNQLPVQDQGNCADKQLDTWTGERGRSDGGGIGCSSGMGAVAARPASNGGSADV